MHLHDLPHYRGQSACCCFMMTDLHQEAARIIQKFNSKEGFIKNLVYSSSFGNLRQLFALVSESIKYQSILEDILNRSGISLLSEELVGKNEELAIVLLYEELVGAGFGRAGHVRKMMRKYKAEIKAAHEAFLKENNAESLAHAMNGNFTERNDFPTLPRYARVNLIKSTVQEGIDRLCEVGWEYKGKLHVDRFKEDVSSLSESQFGLDPLLEDVLVFPFGTDLHKDKLVIDGILVLQERASCVPAHVLNPPPGSVVLDCCAAPGNKTGHIASLMGDQGHVIALDRDAKRVVTMNSLLQRTGATCVETFAQDFLTLSPDSEEASNISMILLDPSCSCTGMPTGTSYRQEVPFERLQSLKRYQISLLKHALRFPNVQRVVYSTCSISPLENEEVVEEVIYRVKHCFNFVPVLPDWPNSRGLKKFLHHENFLRVSPEEHLSAGFFVACFERFKKPENDDCNTNTRENRIDGKDSECGVVEEDGESKQVQGEGTDCLENDGDEKVKSHSSKKKKKKKHRSEDEQESVCEESDAKKKKKRRKYKSKSDEDGCRTESSGEEVEEKTDCLENIGNEKRSSHSSKKKKKKKHRSEDEQESVCEEIDDKKKKKRRKDESDEDGRMIEREEVEENLTEGIGLGCEDITTDDRSRSKKRKKRDENDDAEKKERKKKRKERGSECVEFSADPSLSSDSMVHSENVQKKKKKKKKSKERDDSE